MEGHEDAVTLRLTGENAKGGIELSALQQFVGHFVGALRRFDRVGRAEPAVKGGHPERRAEAVTAFRLVALTKGSAVLTLEPVALGNQGEEPLFDEGDKPPLDNVQAMPRLWRPERGWIQLSPMRSTTRGVPSEATAARSRSACRFGSLQRRSGSIES